MELFSLTGIIIMVIVVVFLGKILSYMSKFIYYAIIALIVLIFIFGISLDEILNFVTNLLLWAL